MIPAAGCPDPRPPWQNPRMKALSLVRLAISIGIAAFMGSAPGLTQTAENLCDQLASAPTDTNRTRPGVSFEQLDAAAAIAACQDAVQSSPTELRFKFQFARALQKAGRFGEAASLYEPLAKAQYAAASHNLALMYLAGSGLDRNTTKAIALLQQAAELGNPLSQYQLGLFYMTGQNVERNLAIAKDWYTKAAAQGNPNAQNDLGVLYQKGLGVPQDDAKALELYKKSAAQGFAAAQANVGWMYANGRGVSLDNFEAAKWLAAAAEQGNANAQNDLGLLYQNGLGVPRDEAKALELYKNSSARGLAIASANVGWMYANGRGIAQDKAEAAKWYTTAAEQGNAWAQNELGEMYVNGNGVSRDYDKAISLLLKASAAGNSNAEANVGYMYLNGFGVPKDFSEAERRFRSAARAKNGFAMSLLGWMYSQGNGVPRDAVKAYIWYRLAVDAGSQTALLPLAALCTGFFAYSQDLQEIISAGQMEAFNVLNLNSEQAANSTALPNFINNDLRQTILNFQTNILGSQMTREQQEERDKIADRYALDYTIAHDAFLSENAEFAKAALVRNENQSLAEAVSWYKQAIATGSVDAILQAANLYLSGDPTLSQQNNSSWSWTRFTHLASSNSEQFIGSAAKAAVLYEDAISKGSSAARINLATLYEIGFGVTKDLDKAHSLYDAAVGSTFDAKAQLGLLRIELNSYLDNERSRSQRLVADVSQTSEEKEKDDDIVVESLVDYTTIDIRDPKGARVFGGSLPRGQQYIIPRDRSDLILWVSSYSQDNMRVRVGQKTINMPPSRKYHYGIRLNRSLLMSGANYLIQRSDDDEPTELPEETIAQSRIALEVLSKVDLYVHSDDHVIGFYKSLDSGHRFRVPRLEGLTLELRPIFGLESSSDKPQPVIAILVDGVRVLNLIAPQGCFIRLSLDISKLRKATVSAQNSCDGWAEDAPESSYVMDASGDPIGFIKKLPNETVPKDPSRSGVRVIGSLHLNRGIALLSLRIGGRWDEVLRALRIFLQWDMRDKGPNSFDTLRTVLDLCDIEIKEGDVALARDHLDQAIERLNELGTIPQQTRVNSFRNFGSLLLRLGRYAEAERFLVLANQLQRETNQAHGQAVESGLRFDDLSQTREKLGDLDGTLAYQLRVLLDYAFSNLESSEKINKNRLPSNG